MKADLLNRRRVHDHAPGRFPRPFDQFGNADALIRRIDDQTYPRCREASGISPWFKVKLYDFYHGGIVVVLRVEHVVIDGGGAWAVVPYGSPFNQRRFSLINAWHLGRIPFRNIRHYDKCGDEIYPFPHIYCSFDDDGMPYESFEYAKVGGDREYDWPLDPQRQLAETDATIITGSSI